MAVKLTRLTHKIAIRLYLMAESCTICSSPSRPPGRKLLDIPSYFAASIFKGYRTISVSGVRVQKTTTWLN